MKYKWTPSYAHLKDSQIKKLDQLLKNKTPMLKKSLRSPKNQSWETDLKRNRGIDIQIE